MCYSIVEHLKLEGDLTISIGDIITYRNPKHPAFFQGIVLAIVPKDVKPTGTEFPKEYPARSKSIRFNRITILDANNRTLVIPVAVQRYLTIKNIRSTL